jgi:CheY-like chemotaxis protein
VTSVCKFYDQRFTNTIFAWENGADALAVYAEHHPDAVLMDLRMPRMDGLTATRQILRQHPAARIVIVTALALGERAMIAGQRLRLLRY